MVMVILVLYVWLTTYCPVIYIHTCMCPWYYFCIFQRPTLKQSIWICSCCSSLLMVNHATFIYFMAYGSVSIYDQYHQAINIIHSFSYTMGKWLLVKLVHKALLYIQVQELSYVCIWLAWRRSVLFLIIGQCLTVSSIITANLYNSFLLGIAETL